MKVKYYEAETNSFKNGLLKGEGLRHYVEPVEEENFKTGLYLSPGWIDIHTHIFDGFGLFGINADKIGWNHGVCLVVDAGTVGDFTINGFKKYVAPTIKTNFRLFLCVSPIGVIFHHEYNAMQYLDTDRTVETINQNRDFVSGIKVRIGSEVIRFEGVEPLKIASAVARKTGLPLMVHIGGVPPYFEDIEPYLSEGDVLTHVFNGRGTGVWNADGTPTEAMRKVIDKGVHLDVGHGSASFDFDVFRKAALHPLPRLLIGTDLHAYSINRGALNMETTLSKMLGLGVKLEDIMYGVTKGPAQVLHLDKWCDMSNLQNATMFRVVDKEKVYTDSNGNSYTFAMAIEPVAVILNNQLIELG